MTPKARVIPLTAALLLFLLVSNRTIKLRAEIKPTPLWQFQAVDTMKYSRDPAREKLNDPKFSAVVNDQVKRIAETGATHVAIATPYDEEFLPILKLWVNTARKYGLSVWFRGNWSGWEGWFGYPKITRQEHLTKTQAFIENHAPLFADGDVFSACPECENGGPGDPRSTGDVAGHRQFLIQEYQITTAALKKIGKDVRSNFDSMNGDVARLIMDKETTAALGAVVTIDHYVASTDKLVKDIKDFAQKSGGQVVLGEFGAPIPDIHGQLSAEAQSKWVSDALEKITGIPELVGINYWTNQGSSTALWNLDGSPRPVVGVVTKYFIPVIVSGIIIDDFGNPIKDVKISTVRRSAMTDNLGIYSLPTLLIDKEVTVSAAGYKSVNIPLKVLKLNTNIELSPIREDLFHRILKLIFRIFNHR